MQLYRFQQYGVDWLTARETGAVLADDMGLGKTVIAANALRKLDAARSIVVCPSSVRYHWSNTLTDWWPDAWVAVVEPRTMTPPMRLGIIRDPYWRVVVLSYEMMRAYADDISRQKWDVVIFDEAHRLGNRKSQTHKASRLITRKACAKRVWGLTGTPVQNAVSEYWPLLRTLVPGFGSYWEYVRKYATIETVENPYNGQVYGKRVTNPAPDDPRLAKLATTIAPYVLRRTKQEVLTQLPPKTYTRIGVDFDRVQADLYKQMEATMRVVLPNGDDVTADTVIAQQTRLLQLCVDWQLLRADEKAPAFNGPKVAAFLDHVDALGRRPFVVFSQWSRVLRAVAKLLADRNVESALFIGDTAATRANDLQRWRRGETQALLVTIAAGGVGLDFTHADIAFFLDRSWNPKANQQAEDRLHRHGQHNPVNVIDFYVRGTIEEQVLQTNDDKTAVSDAVVR